MHIWSRAHGGIISVLRSFCLLMSKATPHSRQQINNNYNNLPSKHSLAKCVLIFRSICYKMPCVSSHIIKK
jgi:hypothetical protein